MPAARAASSQNPHCVSTAASPSSVYDAMESMPAPCLPAAVMPAGLIVAATAMGIFGRW